MSTESTQRESEADALKHKLDDQRERIDALARGREEDLATIGDLRAELALVSRERDELRKKLTALEAMQTETLTLSQEELDRQRAELANAVPSIDELISSFSGTESLHSQSHATLRAEPPDSSPSGEFQEMLAPDEMVFDSGSSNSRRALQRFLVQMGPDGPFKLLLNQDLLTIGRSDSADIQVNGDFISRIHARVLRIGMDMIIEDAGSKNGTRVNSELIDRYVLKHGDLIRVGSAQFRYFDSAAAERNEE